MNKTFLLSLLIGLILAGCGETATPFEEKKKTPEELKIELVASEKTTPLKYLSVVSNMRPDQKLVRQAGIFREAEYAPDGATITGTIKSSATIARFKDVVLTVDYFSKTQTKIESKDYIMYEYYNANSTKPFELKVYPPKAMKNFNVTVKNATPVD